MSRGRDGVNDPAARARGREGARLDPRPTLSELHEVLNAADAREPFDPVGRELAWAMSRFSIPRAPLDELLSGVARDLGEASYQNWHHLQEYCAGVASSVGEMSTYVFGLSDPAGLTEARRFARRLGVAMQLTNVLRDVGEDARRGRCYLPLEELADHGLHADQVLTRTVDVTSDAWQALMRRQIARARELYREAMPGIALLAADSRACALACARGYAGILTRIEANEFDVFARRASLGWAARLRVAMDSMTASSFDSMTASSLDSMTASSGDSMTASSKA